MSARLRRFLIASGVTVPVVISCALLAGRYGDLAGIMPSLVNRAFLSPALRLCLVLEGPRTSDIGYLPALSTRICYWAAVVVLTELLSVAVAVGSTALGMPRLAGWSRRSRNIVCLGWVVAVLLVAAQVPPLHELLKARGSLDLDAADRVRLWFLFTALAISLPIGILLIMWRRSRGMKSSLATPRGSGAAR
jgi:hypothetical protein